MTQTRGVKILSAACLAPQGYWEDDRPNLRAAPDGTSKKQFHASSSNSLDDAAALEHEGIELVGDANSAAHPGVAITGSPSDDMLASHELLQRAADVDGLLNP